MQFPIFPIVVACAIAGAATLIALVLLAIAYRRWRRSRQVPVMLLVVACSVGAAAVLGLAAFVFVGMTFPVSSRKVVVSNGVTHRIEHEQLWGRRRRVCLGWDDQGKLDGDSTGYYMEGNKVAEIVIEADGLGFCDDGGKEGPWLFIGADREPDRTRSGWYEADQPIPDRSSLGLPSDSIRPLDQDLIDDLLLAWKSR